MENKGGGGQRDRPWYGEVESRHQERYGSDIGAMSGKKARIYEGGGNSKEIGYIPPRPFRHAYLLDNQRAARMVEHQSE